jgi:hypothetical protein
MSNIIQNTNQKLSLLAVALTSLHCFKKDSAAELAKQQTEASALAVESLHEVVCHIRHTDSGWTAKAEKLLVAVHAELPALFDYCERTVRSYVKNNLVIIPATKKTSIVIKLGKSRPDFYYPSNFEGITFEQDLNALNSVVASAKQALADDFMDKADIKKETAKSRKAERELESANAERDLENKGYLRGRDITQALADAKHESLESELKAAQAHIVKLQNILHSAEVRIAELENVKIAA